jgi:hypothetical protein
MNKDRRIHLPWAFRVVLYGSVPGFLMVAFAVRLIAPSIV